MEIVENEIGGALNQPLLKNIRKKKVSQKAFTNVFKLTARLSNLLPTGSVLAFQTLVPVFTHEGKCRSQLSQILTSILLSICGISCFVLSFTDSFRDNEGKVTYGMATFSGLWVIDGSIRVPPEKAREYKLRFIDVFHAFLSMGVFTTLAMSDKNVVNCFYPEPSETIGELLSVLPIGVGVLCSALFGVFPTTRHGIGFPLSEN
nr:protein DMP4-like [Tanacetum cinerariifolium]